MSKVEDFCRSGKSFPDDENLAEFFIVPIVFTIGTFDFMPVLFNRTFWRKMNITFLQRYRRYWLRNCSSIELIKQICFLSFGRIVRRTNRENPILILAKIAKQSNSKIKEFKLFKDEFQITPTWQICWVEVRRACSGIKAGSIRRLFARIVTDIQNKRIVLTLGSKLLGNFIRLNNFVQSFYRSPRASLEARGSRNLKRIKPSQGKSPLFSDCGFFAIIITFK